MRNKKKEKPRRLEASDERFRPTIALGNRKVEKGGYQ